MPEELNLEIADTIFECLSPSPILVEDSDSLIEEIDLFLAFDDSMPPGIEDDDYDYGRNHCINVLGSSILDAQRSGETDESESEEGGRTGFVGKPDAKKEEKPVAANKKDLIRMSVFSDDRVNGIADTRHAHFVVGEARSEDGNETTPTDNFWVKQ
ncbi:hypothetical protein Tco_0848630 [Tanacetum coccineum]